MDCLWDRFFLIGVDIEKIQLIDLKVAQRFFSEKEYEDLIAKTSSERIAYFYDLWTLKESLTKTLGIGLTIPLNSFS